VLCNGGLCISQLTFNSSYFLFKLRKNVSAIPSITSIAIVKEISQAAGGDAARRIWIKPENMNNVIAKV
jgi:hypothetical protein